jgi:hypothetical protein
MKGFREVKNLLFSEEKRSKKDFNRLLHGSPRQQMDESFLVLFFKKEHPSFLDQDHAR